MKCNQILKYYYFWQSTLTFVILQYYYLFSSTPMYNIYAGTAFGQVIEINLHSKKKTVNRLGNMKKQKILNMQFHSDYNLLYYNSDKHLYQYNLSTSVQQKVDDSYLQTDKIVNFQLFQDQLIYGLSNGSIISIKKDTQQNVNLLTQTVKGQAQYKRFIYNDKELILMVGKNVHPFIYDINKVVVSWRGKNVPNDYLDLQVPINDVDAIFFNQKNIACANSDNKVRLYDVRGNKTKPYQDIDLKLQKTYSKTFLTKIISSIDQNYFYLGNNVGSIYQCDLRKNLSVTGKFKGISTSITDLTIDRQHLYTTSLDCYVRKFNIQTKTEEQKFYTNKALHCICLLKDDQVDRQFAQQELPLDQDQNQQEDSKKNTKKMKQMRKRNKVGLKYLQPVNWDEVQLKYEHDSENQVKSQAQELNSKDQFEQGLSLKYQDQDQDLQSKQNQDEDLQDSCNE